MHLIIPVVSFITALSLSQLAFSKNPIELADRHRSLDSSHSVKVSIISKPKNDQSSFDLFLDQNKSLAIQKTPERSANRKLLLTDEGIWLSTPGIRKPVRIGIEQRLFGEISNGDILRTRFNEDYSHKQLKSDSEKVLKFELLKKGDLATYAKIEYHIDAKSYRPILAHFFTASGQKYKTATYSGYKSIAGHPIFTQVEIVDLIKKTSSVIKYTNHKKLPLKESFFSKEALVD